MLLSLGYRHEVQGGHQQASHPLTKQKMEEVDDEDEEEELEEEEEEEDESMTEKSQDDPVSPKTDPTVSFRESEEERPSPLALAYEQTHRWVSPRHVLHIPLVTKHAALPHECLVYHVWTEKVHMVLGPSHGVLFPLESYLI